MRLLTEEMRRILAYLDWHANWWLAQRGRRSGLNGAVESGLRAYAVKQAACKRALARKFAEMWWPTLAKYNVACTWIYPHLSPATRATVSTPSPVPSVYSNTPGNTLPKRDAPVPTVDDERGSEVSDIELDELIELGSDARGSSESDTDDDLDWAEIDRIA